jgi:hypothetical protein
MHSEQHDPPFEPARGCVQVLAYGKNCTLYGILPRDVRSFSFYPLQTDAWLLITPASEYGKRPWDTMTGVFGRLKPGTSRAAAQDGCLIVRGSNEGHDCSLRTSVLSEDEAS